MKKKLWCVLCIVTCMLLIPACGQKKSPEKKKQKKQNRQKQNLKTEKVLK